MIKYNLIYAFFESQGNVLIVKGISLTTITSYAVSITECNIFCMIFSIIFLKTKYNLKHYIGSLVAMIGVIFAIFLDSPSTSVGGITKKQLEGDILIFFGEVSIALLLKKIKCYRRIYFKKRSS